MSGMSGYNVDWELAPSLVTKSNARRGVIYVAGNPLLNRRCTTLPGTYPPPK